MHINRKRQSDSQPALDAQSSAQEAKPKRRAFGLQRIALACVGVLGTASLLALAGCPANLEDPQRFDVAATNGGAGPTGGGSSMGGAVTVVPAPACVTTIFTASCSVTCHFAGGPLSAGLDLTGMDVANRLVNVTAMHAMASPNTSCTAGVKFIDTANPSASWLLAKVNGTQGMCGLQMPFGMTALPADQIACITAFVMSEASGSATTTGGAGAAAGGAAAGGAAATATGGASTAGSGGM